MQKRNQIEYSSASSAGNNLASARAPACRTNCDNNKKKTTRRRHGEGILFGLSGTFRHNLDCDVVRWLSDLLGSRALPAEVDDDDGGWGSLAATPVLEYVRHGLFLHEFLEQQRQPSTGNRIGFH